MDVAIQVSHNRRAPQSGNIQTQFGNELKLCHMRHKNIVRLIGFSSSADYFYPVYEMIYGNSVSNIINGLSWENMLKILKEVSTGISYLHGHKTGPYVIGNICPDNILVTEDFIPKIYNLKNCVMEGDTQTAGSVGYYSNTEEGKTADRKDDVLAFGIFAMQLLTKSPNTTGEGSNLHVKHILDMYVPQFKCGIGLAHQSYGQPKEERKLTEMVIGCLKKNGRADIASFRKDLCLLSLARQLVG